MNSSHQNYLDFIINIGVVNFLCTSNPSYHLWVYIFFSHSENEDLVIAATAFIAALIEWHDHDNKEGSATEERL